MSLQFKITNTNDGKQTITIYQDALTFVVDRSHPNFDEILHSVIAEDDNVVELINPLDQIAERFERITERVSVSNNRIYFDGDEIEESPLIEQILRALEEGDEVEWIGLVNFYEKLAQNPEQHSRDQLFNWLRQYGGNFTITLDGDLILYKGVDSDLKSSASGKATVDGVVHTGRIPNPIGATVEMPRSSVAHDPGSACSVGLHTATYDFASGWGDVVLAVIVNPRDVVSVPTDADKIRVCRYFVKGIVDAPQDGVVYKDEDDCDCEEDTVNADEFFDGLDAEAVPSTYNSQSPLDQYPTCEQLMALYQDGTCSWNTSTILKWLEEECGVITTKDSLRRFKKRHGLV